MSLRQDRIRCAVLQIVVQIPKLGREEGDDTQSPGLNEENVSIVDDSAGIGVRALEDGGIGDAVGACNVALDQDGVRGAKGAVAIHVADEKLLAFTVLGTALRGFQRGACTPNAGNVLTDAVAAHGAWRRRRVAEPAADQGEFGVRKLSRRKSRYLGRIESGRIRAHVTDGADEEVVRIPFLVPRAADQVGRAFGIKRFFVRL